MSTNAITSISSASANVQQTTAAASLKAALAAAQEEASETAATTRQEAAQGDTVAIRRLAKLQQAKGPQQSAPASEPGKGERIDRTA